MIIRVTGIDTTDSNITNQFFNYILQIYSDYGNVCLSIVDISTLEVDLER